MNLSVAKYSHRGGRLVNEDYLGFCANDSIGCFVLADGTGGYQGGAQASEAVVKHILDVFAIQPAVTPDMIHASLGLAKEALNAVKRQHPEFTHMNTTVATLMLDAHRRISYWSHLGDSRIYLFRHGRARQLTRDHSVLQSMIDAGFASGSSRGNTERNTLYASVGSVEVPQQAVSASALMLESGDAFLLCSDGFWESVDESCMESALRQSGSSAQWLDEMVRTITTIDDGSRDNLSAMAVWVGEQEETTRIQTFPVHEGQ
ncbi:PP2C family protein-serine/threonine phosphatase [Lampropedia aestuarii]|uniref:PP2C family protein-serine/threonine phosphatase n=1 Tax=Lampropedia aestuarii TaxID=2562762 RepID=UPI002469A364|nr:serine/threonine-protein phosphatase [Lampropedia aestuarii]MDH5857396.1 serine/threonine-protein phosphatase [Lampropedia aestuarii]